VIRTVTLNPAVDRTATIEKFAVDAVNRVVSARLDAGGKGINVSKAIRLQGGTSAAYGFLGGAAGAFIRAFLAEQGIENRFVEIDGETRTNLKIVDPVLGTHTDINESGPPIKKEALERLEAELFSKAGSGDLFVFSGSTGNGVDTSVYASWIRRCRELGARTLLDADGAALVAGAAARPTAMKPNIDELARLVGRPLGDIAATAVAARSLLGGGTELVVVSLGAEGALFFDSRASIRAHGIPIKPLSTVGAGDSLVAALALGLERGDDLERLVRPAVAAGTAAAATAGSAPFEKETMIAFESKVRYEFI
jgi:1-phosphofructokinase